MGGLATRPARVMDKLAATAHEGDAQWTASIVAESLLRIDPAHAEELLIEPWNSLGNRDTFVQLATSDRAGDTGARLCA